MDLPDLKKLKAIIALCRKSGVDSIEIAGVKITLKDQISSSKQYTKRAKAPVFDNTPDVPEVEELTQEQLLNWSVFSPPEASEETA